MKRTRIKKNNMAGPQKLPPPKWRTDQERAKALARYVVLSFIKNGSNVTNLTLQKILYYIQAWHLVYFKGDPLFDQRPEAWVNGPVYPFLYRVYKDFGSGNIELEDVKADNWDLEAEKIVAKLKISDDQIELIDSVIKQYSPLSPFQLVLRTHSEKPWLEARGALNAVTPSNNDISFETMAKYYSERVKKAKKK